MLEALIIAGVTGAVSAIVTIATIKTDMAWVKRVLSQQHNRISKLEGKIL